METQQLRHALENTGLTQYEASAYVALVELGTASAVEIADASDVPQARIYDVLRDLESDGYVETYEQESLHARAHDPSEVLDDLHDYAETITDAAAEIERRWERPELADHKVSVVKRFETVLDRARDAIRTAENEIEAALTPDTFRELSDVLEGARDRNVVVKLTISPTAGREVDIDAIRDELERAATEVRHRRLPTPFLVLCDRTTVCFAPEQSLSATGEYGVLVDDYSLSRMLDWYFQTALWDYWEVVYSARDGNMPAVYTNLRECIRDIEPVLDDGGRVIVTVEGRERAEGGNLRLTGSVVDVTYTGSDDAGESPPLAAFVEEATIRLDTDDGVYEVGGWGALFEDIEARRIVVEAVE